MTQRRQSSTNKSAKTKANTKGNGKDKTTVVKLGIRRQMQITLIILGILGTVCLGIAGVLASINHKSFSVWTLFVSLIIYSFTLCLYLQDYIWRDDTITSQSIPKNVSPTSSQQPTPKVPTFREKSGDVTITFGGNSVLFSMSQLEGTPIRFPILQKILTDQNQLIIYVKDKKPYVDVQVYGGSQIQPIEIKRNEFTKPPDWDSNSNDEALEIVNEKQEPVFQLYYKTPSHIVINGIFLTPKGHVAVASETGIQINSASSFKNTLTRIFKYPAWKYSGQFDDSNPLKDVSPTPVKPKK